MRSRIAALSGALCVAASAPVEAQTSPAAELRSYDSCLASLTAFDSAYLQLSEEIGLIVHGSRRAYSTGDSDDAPGLVLFRTMKEEPENLKASYKTIRDALSKQCNSVWE